MVDIPAVFKKLTLDFAGRKCNNHIKRFRVDARFERFVVDACTAAIKALDWVNEEG